MGNARVASRAVVGRRPRSGTRGSAAESGATSGAQSLRRAVALLRIVAVKGDRGASLADVVALSGLRRATAHRMLRVLHEEGLLEHERASRTYRLGVEVFALSAAMGDRCDIKRLAHASLERLSRATDDTAYSAIRSGPDGLCVDMREGSYPQKTIRLNVGDRWPLGVGSFSMPLLAFLPDSEVAEIIAHNTPRLLGQDQYTPRKLLRQVRETRSRGYAVNQILAYPTMCGIGVPVLDQHRKPIASLCVTAVISRMTAERREWLADKMWQESRKISDLWCNMRVVGARADHWEQALDDAREWRRLGGRS